MKLNIGSSNVKGTPYNDPEWINIDCGSGRFTGNVLNIDACDMPKDWTDKFDIIHSIHCLEHVNRNLRNKFVEECHRVLKPGGQVFIEVPDFRKIIKACSEAIETGDFDLEHRMTTSIFGKQRYIGDQHCWGYTYRTLAVLLQKAEFKDVVILTDIKDMISKHYAQEPVLLARGTK